MDTSEVWDEVSKANVQRRTRLKGRFRYTVGSKEFEVSGNVAKARYFVKQAEIAAQHGPVRILVKDGKLVDQGEK